MHDTLLVFRKELVRFVSDKLSAMVAVVLPGVLIFVMWTVMGSVLAGLFADVPPHVALVGSATGAHDLLADAGIEIEELGELPSVEEMHESIRKREVEAFVVVSDEFDEVARTLAQKTSSTPLQVELYYNSGVMPSQMAYDSLLAVFDEFEDSISNVLDVNAGDHMYDVATEHDQASFMMVSIVPFMLLTLVFSSCMSTTSESVAGEKERGTLAALLATPARRRDIARGKVLACSLVALAVAISSALGIFAGFPAVMQGEFDMSVYGPTQYCLIGLVVLSVTLLINALIMIVSSLAKTTKEAQTCLVPVMIVVMGIGLLGVAGGGAQAALWVYLIPLYNGVEAMIGILSFDYSLAGIALCLVSNAIFTSVAVVVLERLFESERVMFGR